MERASHSTAEELCASKSKIFLCILEPWESLLKGDHNWMLLSQALHLWINFPSSCTSRYVGEFCEYANPCLTAPRCQNGGTCEVLIKDGQASFQCKCPVGFSASLCEISEETACSSSPCRNNGKCFLKSLKEYECRCPEGFSGKHFIYEVDNSVITLMSCFIVSLCRQELWEVEFMRNIAVQERGNMFDTAEWEQIQMFVPARL